MNTIEEELEKIGISIEKLLECKTKDEQLKLVASCYRKKMNEVHPDVNPNNPKAEEMSKEINRIREKIVSLIRKGFFIKTKDVEESVFANMVNRHSQEARANAWKGSREEAIEAMERAAEAAKASESRRAQEKTKGRVADTIHKANVFGKVFDKLGERQSNRRRETNNKGRNGDGR